MIRLIFSLMLMSSLVSAATQAAALGAGSVRMDRAGLAVDSALSDVLERNGMARIEVTLDLTEEREADLDHPAAGSGVHAAVFDIAMMAAEGPMALDQIGTFHLISLAASEAAVGKILEMKEVVAVHLGTDPVEKARPSEKGSVFCEPGYNPKQACFGAFAVFAGFSGAAGKVAVNGTDSATFWTYSPNNWEILVKVLNGCAINGHHWLLASAASTSTYSLGVFFASFHVGFFSATNQPIVNLQLRECGAPLP